MAYIHRDINDDRHKDPDFDYYESASISLRNIPKRFRDKQSVALNIEKIGEKM
jgi:hypothetical protein